MELGELDPAALDAVLDQAPFNPFVTRGFLSALEESGCIGGRTGWTAAHAACFDDKGTLIGFSPQYVKAHSYGEYVFDHAWADAFERAGGRYYPKLLVAVPFSPVTGPRLIAKPAARAGLIEGLVTLAARAKVSSLHVNFLTEDDAADLTRAGFLAREDRQFHWFNDGYRDFQDFLDALSSRKRKQIRKEREQALSPGIEVEVLSGSDLREDHWDAFYAFYMDTGARKWGSPYLNRLFFSLLSEKLADHIVLILAKRNGRYVAGALNLVGPDALYGRNWGCIEDHPCLHFELCYYQAIEHAISRGMMRVEAGAQGEHKLARGYRPVTTRSAHWIAHPGLRDAVARYLDHERRMVQDGNAVLADHLPFRQIPPPEEEA